MAGNQCKSVGMDTSDLRGLYEEFLALGAAGGFGPPPEGEWRAELVLAHIACNDARLLATTQAVIDGRDATYTNEGIWQNESDELEQYVRDTPDLLAAIRTNRDALLAAVEQLGDKATTEVPATITHAGHVVLDGPVPWADLVAGASIRHIGMHIEQLQALKA